MGGFISGQKKRANDIPTADTTLRLSTSVQGRPRPLLYGQTRYAPNILMTAGFIPILGPSGQSGVAGGKGGGGGGKGAQQGQVQWSWYYFVDLIYGFGSVPIKKLPAFWAGKNVAVISVDSCFYNNPNDATLYQTSISTLTGQVDVDGVGDLITVPGTTLFPGDFAQMPWDYLVSLYPNLALAYRGEAYIGWGHLALGTSANIPSLNFEVQSSISFDVKALGPDANPKDVITDYLTNTWHGVPSFSASYLGDWTSYRDYCRATGQLVSIAETSTRAANSFLQDIMKFTCAEFVWSGGLLNIVPYADAQIVGNGTTWTPNTQAVYGFGDDDFLDKNKPVQVNRKPISETVNHVRVEYLDRNWFYNPEIIDLIDEAAVANAGIEIMGDVESAHIFALAGAAQVCAANLLQRGQIVGEYVFTVGRRFILLDPMDIVTLTTSHLGMVGYPVRIKEIQENSDRTLTITAEDYPGTATAPKYGIQTTNGNIVNYNVSPGDLNAPIIFEPPEALSKGLAVYIAISGQATDRWGGAEIWASYDGDQYAQVGTVRGPARMGLTSAVLPSVTKNPSGQPTIDNTNVLSVDLTESNGELTSGSAIDLNALNLLAYVGGELVAYQNAVLTAANKYDLSPLVRGALESDIAAHPIGTPFVRVDDAVAAIPFTPDRIGSTVYLKFRSFNVYGAGQADLSQTPVFTYLITGAALSSPLDQVENLRLVYEDGFAKLWWDEVDDPRGGIRYIIKKGATYESAIMLADVAHPPLIVFGNDTYWVMPYCVPTPGLTVYATAATGLTGQGNTLPENIVTTVDEQATNWLGALTNFTRVGASGSEILQATSGASQSTYEVTGTSRIDIGYEADVAINVSWQAAGAPAGQNILAITDFLNTADIFGASASAFITSYVEISIAHNDVNDVFDQPDVFDPTDVFAGPVNWGDWQKFVPGTYRGRFFKFRVQVLNSNPTQVTGFLALLNYTASVPVRLDHYQGLAVAAGGTVVTFKPDGATVAAPFNGGPNGATLPYYSASWSMQAGDQLVVSGLSKSQMTVQVLNGGVGVARTINLDVEGY